MPRTIYTLSREAIEKVNRNDQRLRYMPLQRQKRYVERSVSSPAVRGTISAGTFNSGTQAWSDLTLINTIIDGSEIRAIPWYLISGEQTSDLNEDSTTRDQIQFAEGGLYHLTLDIVVTAGSGDSVEPRFRGVIQNNFSLGNSTGLISFHHASEARQYNATGLLGVTGGTSISIAEIYASSGATPIIRAQLVLFRIGDSFQEYTAQLAAPPEVPELPQPSSQWPGDDT